MKKSVLLSCLWLAIQAPMGWAAAGKPQLGTFGLELGNRDLAVKPGDDFDRYANGQWFDGYQLKDYETRYGSFTTLSDQAEVQVREIIEAMAETGGAEGDAQKVRDLYRSYMDQERRNAAGIKPLQPVLDEIAAIEDLADLTTAFGRASLLGTSTPLSAGIGLDRKNPDRYLLGIGVGGLGLPDKEFYLGDDARSKDIRAAYVKHIARMLGYTGVDDVDQRAAAILELETRIARHHWNRVDLRDRDKTYNLTSFDALTDKYPGYDFAAHLAASGTTAPKEVNVNTPSALKPIIEIINDTPLPLWRDYLRFHAVDNNAEFLSAEIDAASFDFNGRVLSGQKAQREQWKRALTVVASSYGLGDVIGRKYVELHFSPESKAAMEALVENLRKALRQNIERLDWMGEETKKEAYKKLESFRPKVGYPSKWRDYSKVSIVPDDLLANMRALRRFYLDDSAARLNRPTDKDEWFITPHTVNAYYNSSFNEIVFPAAILQPPFFDLHADPAVNYGAIGAVIGHEMGHGFDDQGSKSDHAGIQRNWWTDPDRKRFEERTRALAAQFSAYCPLEGHCVNGQLTLGENIGDLGGLSMAYTAYQLSLEGKSAPVIDNLTGDQRFFMAWAQVWKAKYRDEALINMLRVDPHSPPRYRINGPLRNLDEWYRAFDVQEKDALYLPPDQRVRIW